MSKLFDEIKRVSLARRQFGLRGTGGDAAAAERRIIAEARALEERQAEAAALARARLEQDALVLAHERVQGELAAKAQARDRRDAEQVAQAKIAAHEQAINAAQMRMQAPGEAQNAAQPRTDAEADYRITIASTAGAHPAVNGRSAWHRTVAGTAVILAAGIGIGAWLGTQPEAPAGREARVAEPLAEAQGLPLSLRVDDELERFDRSVNASAANRGSERVPAR